jgi:hypothetical protein
VVLPVLMRCDAGRGWLATRPKHDSRPRSVAFMRIQAEILRFQVKTSTLCLITEHARVEYAGGCSDQQRDIKRNDSARPVAELVFLSQPIQ